MKFEQGNKASAGRPQGAKNKKTLLGRDIIENYFIQDGGLETLLQEIDSLGNLNDKINAKIKLLPYLMPKQKEIELNVTEQGNKTGFDLTKLNDSELLIYMELAKKCEIELLGGIAPIRWIDSLVLERTNIKPITSEADIEDLDNY